MASGISLAARLTITLAATLLSLSLAAPIATAQILARRSPCHDSLWGCGPSADAERSDPGEARRAHYDRLVTSARRLLSTLRSTSVNAGAQLVKEAEQQLRDAIQLLPDEPDAHSLLGQLELERGHRVAAALALRQAEALFAQAAASESDGQRPHPPLERSDPALALALALLHAQEGDLQAALARYQRLIDHAAASPRLLYRMADVLMALGQLDDAAALYERACAAPRGPEVPTVDTSRACLGYLVALDRGERAIPATLFRKARTVDRGPRAMDLLDFPSPWERDYHRALLLPSGCERRASLARYLQGSDALAPASYRRRAELHRQRGRELSCPSEP